jgi:hypothetical protein
MSMERTSELQQFQMHTYVYILYRRSTLLLLVLLVVPETSSTDIPEICQTILGKVDK